MGKFENELKELAQRQGADIVGIGQVKRNQYRSIIVVGKLLPPGARDHGFLKVIPIYLQIWQATSNALNSLAAYLGERGYKTKRQWIASLTGDLRPLAERAGLGSKGANEMILNPKFGANVLYASLRTDCELVQDERIDNVCIRCFRCRKYCPGSALTPEGLDVSRCLPYSLRACQKCLDVCPIGSIEVKQEAGKKSNW